MQDFFFDMFESQHVFSKVLQFNISHFREENQDLKKSLPKEIPNLELQTQTVPFRRKIAITTKVFPSTIKKTCHFELCEHKGRALR